MSAIYFHSERETVAIRGPERAHAGIMCSDLFALALGLDGYVDDRKRAQVVALLPEGHYASTLPDLNASGLRAALAQDDSLFAPSLNTMLAMGSDAVKLLARLHGQCEIHAYVAGEDRSWLAGIIDGGRESKVLRAEMGWEGVSAMLRSADDAPVVTSYSVCDQFPNSYVAGWQSVDEGDDWYELPEAEQWRLALAGLYAKGDLRIAPSTWTTFYFGDGATAFDLLAT